VRLVTSCPIRPVFLSPNSRRLSDPGNLGTLLRSAAATRVDEFILLGPGACCDPSNPKAVRATSATTFVSLPHLFTPPSYEDWYDRMRRKKAQFMMTVVPDDHGNDM
jgi:RNA methyltransferase, TrmH family